MLHSMAKYQDGVMSITNEILIFNIFKVVLVMYILLFYHQCRQKSLYVNYLRDGNFYGKRNQPVSEYCHSCRGDWIVL